MLLARPLWALPGRHMVAADAALCAVTLSVIARLYAFGAWESGWYMALLAVSSLLHAWGLSGQYTLVAEHLPPRPARPGNALLPGFGMAAFVIGPLLAGLAVAPVGSALPVAADAAPSPFSPRQPRPGVTGRPPGPRIPASRTGHRRYAAIARARPLAGLLALTIAYYFLYGPVEVALLGEFWTVFGIGATADSIIAGLARRRQVWPVLVAAVMGWGAAYSGCSGTLPFVRFLPTITEQSVRILGNPVEPDGT